MSDYQASFSKILASSYSSDNRDSTDTFTLESCGKDEEFYEEIEAPKFVDFTSPDHFRPDDRFWFCQRVGCDQKHEEGMDSETIYKNFVLRVMAARSPNVKLRKFLDRKCSRTPMKCPNSAPPKSSKPRLSRLALISSISGKMADEKKKVVRPLLKPKSTPVIRGKPVAAKYLTTPRNKKCLPNENSFRSVQNLKSTTTEVPKNQSAAKTLVFHSPKKAIKVKASSESRTPITKLCEGMSELEISSQKKRVLGYSSSKSTMSSYSSASRTYQKLKNKPEKQICVTREAKPTISSNSATKRKLTKQDSSKKSGVDRVLPEVKECGKGTKLKLMDKEIKGESELKECSQESSEQSGKCLNSNKTDILKSEITKIEEKDVILKVASKCSENSSDQLKESISSEAERIEQEFVDSDDKENAPASDGNRMHNGNQRQNGRTIFGVHAKGGEVKKIVPASDKHVKEALVSSGAVMKFKKPKPTNPKPFRLRTDERGILREAKLEEKASQLAPENDTANSSTPGRKLRTKPMIDAHKKEKSSKAVTSLKEALHHSSTREQPKSRTSPLKSNSIHNLEKNSKIKSPLQKLAVKPQGAVKTKKKIISFLIPGQKLDVIHEVSPEVSELKKARVPTEKSTFTNNAGASLSSSCGKQTVEVAMDLSAHTKNLQ